MRMTGLTPISMTLLVILAALWGGSFVFMRVAVPALGPLTNARTAAAVPHTGYTISTGRVTHRTVSGALGMYGRPHTR